MNNAKIFFASASGVILSLTAIVADGATPQTALAAAFAHAQDATVPPTNASANAATLTVSTTSVAMQAKVIEVVGKVRWRANEQTAWKDANPAKVEDLLSAGAEVRTGLESRMTLKFVNATVLIDSNSNFAMPTIELVKENDGDVYRTIAQMKSGRADFQVDKVGAKNDFKVVTPSSTLAVRGTGFSVSTGAMSGTEVTGARTNAIAAIQLKYAASAQTVELSGGGGEAKSSSELPEPATAALVNSIGAPPMAGTATSKAEVLASASASTSQTPVQTQVTSTVAAVATAVAETAAAASGEDGAGSGNGVLALFADLQRVDGHQNAAVAATAAAGIRLQAAVVALGNAQSALTAAQIAGEAFRAAEAGTQEAAGDVATLLSLVEGARSDTDAARLRALLNAQNAFEAFSPGTTTTPKGEMGGIGGTRGSPEQSDSRTLANDALADASDARANANDAIYGAGVAQVALSTTLNQLSAAIAARANIQSADSAASDGASAATTAAADARAFRNLVESARAEIATIFARRPLPGIQTSLTIAIDRLAVAAQHVVDAEQARDTASAAAFSAHSEAQNAVLTAAQSAFDQASTDALAALSAADQADQAAEDAQTGMSKLDLAITAMLQARDAESSAQGTLAAAEAFRDIAQARGVEAQAEIETHRGAEEIANHAAVDASVALLAALEHLDDAIRNSGLTTTALGNCLAALDNGDLSGAIVESVAARDSADVTNVNATDARASADGAQAASVVAGGAVLVSVDAKTNYAARLVELRAALGSAIAERIATQGFATTASHAADAAQTNGNSFAEQFSQTGEGQSAAAAALAAVARAVALAEAAQNYSLAAQGAVDDSNSALASVLDDEGNEINFGTTAVIASGVAADAVQADGAAVEARRLANIADAEALTAQNAVNAGGGLADALVARGQAETDSAGALDSVVLANMALDAVDSDSASSQQSVELAQMAQNAASDGEGAATAIAVILDTYESRLQDILDALNGENLALAQEIRQDGEELGDAAQVQLNLASDAADSASAAASMASEIDATNQVIFGDAAAASLAARDSADASTDAAQTTHIAALATSQSATFADGFAGIALAGGSTQSVTLGGLVAYAQSSALAANDHATAAQTAADAANQASNSVAIRIAGISELTSAIQAQAAADSSQLAQQASAAASATYALGSAEGNTANAAIESLMHKLNAGTAATSVEFLHGQVTGLVAQIDDAIQVHEEALAGAEEAQGLAALALDTVASEKTNADNNFTTTIEHFGGMLAAMQSGDANLALSFAQSTEQSAITVGDAASLVISASNEVQLQYQSAQGFAATSHIQADRAGDALDVAGGLGLLIEEQTQASVASADSAESSASSSQQFASIAHTEIAQALADRALALSIAALQRAQDAIDGRNVALGQVATASSAIEQAGFQATGNIANQLQSSVMAANAQANAANEFAIQAGLYSNLATASSGAFIAGEQANRFRIDAEFSRDGSFAQRDSAQAAIIAHNAALGKVSSLFVAAGESLATAESTSLAAQDFANQANGFFLLATVAHEQLDIPTVILNAGFSDGAATQSEGSATASNAAAMLTRDKANLAAVQAGISNQAGTDYLNAVAAADQFASRADDAHSGAVSAAGQAQAYSDAAANFAIAIGSTQSASAADFAVAARAQAINQRNGALLAQQSAQMAANQARSMGDRVFFTRTAEIASDTAARADQARILADLAISAATQARADATSAQALVPH